MVAALQCPACGAAHAVDELPDAATFRCGKCNQVLSVPAAVRAMRNGGAEPASRGGEARPSSRSVPAPVVASETSDPPAPPRRRSAASVSTTVTEVAERPSARPSPETVAPRRAPRLDAAAEPRQGRARRLAPVAPRARPAWYWRLLAWALALPLGFVVTAVPLYERFVTKDDLVDVFITSGIGRYLRLGIAVAIWALVTALLVQLFVEGGQAVARRRQAPTRSASAPGA